MEHTELHWCDIGRHLRLLPQSSGLLSSHPHTVSCIHCTQPIQLTNPRPVDGVVCWAGRTPLPPRDRRLVLVLGWDIAAALPPALSAAALSLTTRTELIIADLALLNDHGTLSDGLLVRCDPIPIIPSRPLDS